MSSLDFLRGVEKIGSRKGLTYLCDEQVFLLVLENPGSSTPVLYALSTQEVQYNTFSKRLRKLESLGRLRSEMRTANRPMKVWWCV